MNRVGIRADRGCLYGEDAGRRRDLYAVGGDEEVLASCEGVVGGAIKAPHYPHNKRSLGFPISASGGRPFRVSL